MAAMNPTLGRFAPLFAALLAVCPGFSAPAAQNPEIRGLWISRFEWPRASEAETKARIDGAMQAAKDARFNAIFMQVRGQCETFYPSPDEPWAGYYGFSNPGWDPLAYAVEAAHSRGLEFHAYINTHVIYQTSTSNIRPPAAVTTPPHPYYTHANPNDPNHREWCYHNSDGSVQALGAGEDGYLWAAPGVPTFQEWVRRQILHVAKNYNVDGIHLDRIRFAGTGSYDPISVERHAGPGNPTGLGFQAWSRDQITRFLNDLYGQVAEVNATRPSGKPLIKISSAPYRARTQQLGVNQDLDAWCAIGAQDFFVPQVYTTNVSTFGTQLDTNFPLAHGRYVLGGMSRNMSGQTIANIATEIETARSRGARGTVVFSYTGFKTSDEWTYLANNVYTETVATPDMPWLTQPTDAIVIGTVLSRGEPVTDAWITRSNQSGYTWVSGADGFFSMLKVPAGQAFTLTATRQGSGTQSFEVSPLSAGEVRRVLFSLGPGTWVGASQKVHVSTTGTGYQELFYNYETGALSVSDYAASTGPVSFTRPKEQWMGVFHYDYAAASFTQALYSVGDLF